MSNSPMTFFLGQADVNFGILIAKMPHSFFMFTFYWTDIK